MIVQVLLDIISCPAKVKILIMILFRGLNKHRQPTKYISFFTQSSQLLFSSEEETSFNNVVNKNYIIKSELNMSLIMICFQGPLICYALVTREGLPVTQTLYISQFFQHFFVGLCRIYWCANVLNFEYWLLFIACKNWLIVWKLNENIFSWMKNTFFCSQFSPQNTGNHILGLWNSNIFLGEHAPRPP